MINEMAKGVSYSLLAIIVNRGKGSKVLEFARLSGAKDASCLIGKGVVNNKMLQLIEMDEVDKEIIIVVIPALKEEEILNKLSLKFHLDKAGCGIAFAMPLAGMLKIKKDTAVRWNEQNLPEKIECGMTAVLLVVNKGKAEDAMEISQNAGCYGGTVIRAHGSAGKLNIILGMEVEPEKEVVLMLMQTKKANQLAAELNEKLKLSQPNTGILVRIGVSKTTGLFEDNGRYGEGKA